MPPCTPHHGPGQGTNPDPHTRPYAGYQPRGAAFWQVRTSQAERDDVAERLGHAFADGRLDQAEFDRRMHLAMTARTQSDLASLLGDLPGGAPLVPPPQPMAAPQPYGNDRALAALCHLSALFASFVGPLVLLLTVGRDSAFVRDQAAESLNFQITFLLVNAALVVATVMTLGIAALLYIPLGVGWLVLVLVGSVTPMLGRAYRYPLNLRLVR